MRPEFVFYIKWIDGLFPTFVRVFHQHGVEIPGVACHFLAEPFGLGERFVLVGKFDFRHRQPLVVAVKLVNLTGVNTVGSLNQIARFVDDARLGKQ